MEQNIPLKIYLTNEDSTIHYVLLNSTAVNSNKLILTTEEYTAQLKDKFPDSKIILIPQIYEYTSFS